MASFNHFCNDCFLAWHLAPLPEPLPIHAHLGETLSKPRSLHFLEDTPAPKLPKWCYEFQPGRQRVLFLADNSTMTDLINGKASLTDDRYREPFVRMVRNLKFLYTRQWWPRKDWSDYVRWVPRRHNSVADHLANIALDTAESFTWFDVNLQTPSKRGHERIIVASDGGFRGFRAGSSFGWCAWRVVHDDEQSLEMLGFGYKYWTCGSSAFEAEVLGLEHALEMFAQKLL